MIKSKISFWIGAAIIFLILASYFIPITTQDGIDTVVTPLLGILIFYNPFVLIGYILIGLFFIYKGIGIPKLRFE